MKKISDHPARFLRSERGAVTVDYVVLAAAVTGLGLALSSQLTFGMSGLAGTVDSELRRETVESIVGVEYSDGFDNGSGGWSGAGTYNFGGKIGTALGRIEGTSTGAQTVTRSFDIDPNATEATFSFDLYAMDSLDNESGFVYIDGIEIGRMTRDHQGETTFTAAADLEERGIIVRASLIENNVALGGNDRWTDSLAEINVTVKKPKEQITFGFGSNANGGTQGADDESFAIDNFSATGLRNGN